MNTCHDTCHYHVSLLRVITTCHCCVSLIRALRVPPPPSVMLFSGHNGTHHCFMSFYAIFILLCAVFRLFQAVSCCSMLLHPVVRLFYAVLCYFQAESFVLCCAVLYHVVLCCFVLCCVLCCAVLFCAVLCCAVLC